MQNSLTRLVLLSLFGLCVAVRATTVTLQWEPSIDATSYKLYGAEGNAAFSFNQQTSGTLLTVPINTNVMTRFYVTALNSAGESGPSNTVTNSPAGPTPGPVLVLLAPTMTATNVVVGQLVTIVATIRNDGTLPLTLVDGSLTLLMPGGTLADGPYVNLVPITTMTIGGGQSATISGTWQATTPTGGWNAYMVVKQDIGTWTASMFTPFTVLTSPQQIPPAPQNLRLTPVTQTRLDLSWTGTLTASTELERSKESESFRRIATVAPGTMRYTDSVQRHRDYRYRARAKNSAGTSDYTSVVSYNAP